MVETHPERRDCGDDISLSGTRGPGNPRRHSGREAGIQGRESNLAVTIGAKVARAVTLPGLGPGFPAGTTNHPHQNPNHPHQNLAPARFFYVWAILFRALAAGAGLEVVRIDLIEGRPEYLRFSAPTYLLGWLYERVVNRVPGLAWLRVLLVVELRKPG